MATVTSTNCSVCESQYIVKTAVKWCFECDEAFCPDCLKYHSNVKSTKGHAVIDVSDLKELPEFVLKIKQHCDDHEALFQNYCLSHERPCCRKCINSTHKNCTDMPPLDDVIKDARKSTAVKDIQERLQNLKEYHERLFHEKEENAKEIKTQSKTIMEHVKSIRLKLNQHLDRLEREFLEKVSDLEKNALQNIERISRDMKDKGDRTDELNKCLIKMQNHASELQIFLGTKEFEFEISTQEKEIEELTKDHSFDIRRILFKENIKLSDFTSDICSFGDIALETKPSIISYTTPKEHQAQISIEGRKFDDIKLKLVAAFNFEVKMSMFGFAILENGNACYTDFISKTLNVNNPNGVLLHSIVLPQTPYDIVVVNAVTL
ncbi:E3 ubiquitin-protein ligase TRIM71-like [Mytilus trossulus]|uniref:E3 ubiquitin-protein ligase TRIM71-like n=1 Tax=Mytilus trossulus TaxID=6551 RepID=UPI0030047997